MVVAVDNAAVVLGLRKGRAYCCGGGRVAAGAWCLVWDVVKDGEIVVVEECEEVVEGLVQVVKVKAHTKPESWVGFSPGLLRRVQANAAADKRAQEGALLIAERGSFTAWEGLESKVRGVCRYLVAVRCELANAGFLAAEKVTGAGPRERVVRTPEEEAARARVLEAARRRRQTDAKVRRVAPWVGGGLDDGKEDRLVGAAAANGHDLWRVGDWVFCYRCGARATGRAAPRLAVDCTGELGGRATSWWNLVQGKHPKGGPMIGEVTRCTRADLSQVRGGQGVAGRWWSCREGWKWLKYSQVE